MSRILFLFKNSGENIQKSASGKHPKHFYCYLKFKKEFPETEYLDCNFKYNLFLVYLFRILNIKTSYIFFISKLKYLNSFDIIYATTDGIAIDMCYLKKIGFIKTNLIINLFSILDVSSHKNKLKYINYANKVFVYSIDLYNQLIHSVINLKLIQFGIDTDFYKKENEDHEGNYILSIGLDPQRDWLELNNIASKHPNEKFYVISNENIKKYLKQTNINFIGNTDVIKTREYIRKSKQLIITTKNNYYFSGQTTLFMGIAMGKKVIMPYNRNFDFYGLKTEKMDNLSHFGSLKGYVEVSFEENFCFNMDKYYDQIRRYFY